MNKANAGPLLFISSIIQAVRAPFLRWSKVEQGGARCMRGSKVHEVERGGARCMRGSKVHEGEQGGVRFMRGSKVREGE